mgnify:FL=1
MLRNQQNLGQRLQQGMQQKLSPQQLQYIKLLQLTTQGLEQRIKEELETNPILEQVQSEENWESSDQEPSESSSLDSPEIDFSDGMTQSSENGLESLEEQKVDWDTFKDNTEYDGESYTYANARQEEFGDMPDPYYSTLLEDLEQQVSLLHLAEDEQLIADQILGSLDEDGYFRREAIAIADNIAFNHGVYVDEEDVEVVRQKIQRLDPLGIASTDLQDCLQIQLGHSDTDMPGKELAIGIVKDAWNLFEKKHFEKIMSRFEVSEEELKAAFNTIRRMDPKPGAVQNEDRHNNQYIDPDFEVYWQSKDHNASSTGEFVIKLNQRNAPQLRISPDYEDMWSNIKAKAEGPDLQTQQFLKTKLDSAQWFIESIKQRQRTLMNTMKTIVALQEDFFKYGEALRPMILKDIAERIGMDISTISRVVNGKYVQTHFGVYELKYFFNEGLVTESGEEVANREIKNLLQKIIDHEDKKNPLSDQALSDALKLEGYVVARRTVSKYREQLNEPVARLRKQII